MENKEIQNVEQQPKDSWREIVMTYLQNQNTKLEPSELKEFVMLCKAHNLNPIKREIYAVKYGNKFNVITNYYEYLKRADATGLLEYANVEMVDGDNGKPIKAIFIGKRKDQSKELRMEFYFSEWNSGQSTWLTKPHFMLDKCAIANGLRRLFPNELANMPYVNEELWYWNKQNDEIVKEHIAIEEKKETPNIELVMEEVGESK